jgi:copper oxidase (laccase) domain-containing protein
MNPATLKPLVVGVAVALIVAIGGTWKIQDWRYGKELAEQASLHQADLDALSRATTDQMQAEQRRRLEVEQRLSTSEQIHYKELSDAQTNQARLRDRLATSDLRLSVLLQNSADGGPVLAGTGAVGLVHGGARAQLDPAHAQRIIAITDDGDRAVIKLRACQAYVRELMPRHQ